MLEVIKPGLETSIQDWPGRQGYLKCGFPWSGPMDHWSFRLANVLVGNAPGAAGLECQFSGPTLRFQRDGVFALTGADMQAKLDGVPVPAWESIAAKAAKVVQTAGKALVRIRDGQLYRDAAASWEKYLDRHGLTARRANQMIAASAALEAVEAVAKETGTTVPDLTERAVRPLAGLPIEEAKAAIREASADGGLSPRSIAKAAGNRKAKGAKKMQIPRPVRLRLPGGTVIIEVNRKGVASGVTVEALLASALDSLRRQAAA